MGSRGVFIIACLALPIVGFSQKETSWQDSIREKAKVFFTKVDRIDLIKLEPSCVMEKVGVDSLGNSEMAPTNCFDESILLGSDTTMLDYPIDSSRIGETYTLKSDEYDLLFGMLYEGPPSFRRASCHNPRHGITFYNSAGGLIGFLEICFECNRIYALRDTPNMQPLEGEPFKKLKLFFKEKNLVNPVDD
ncbi:MAG: hypothetical protein P8P74_02380 [Crocinitomicaceae bacterium]|nr:hypothetical protein [Crocinitomicaceae bacterium]